MLNAGSPQFMLVILLQNSKDIEPTVYVAANQPIHGWNSMMMIRNDGVGGADRAIVVKMQVSLAFSDNNPHKHDANIITSESAPLKYVKAVKATIS
jgi:hypothetical protein